MLVKLRKTTRHSGKQREGQCSGKDMSHKESPLSAQQRSVHQLNDLSVHQNPATKNLELFTARKTEETERRTDVVFFFSLNYQK